MGTSPRAVRISVPATKHAPAGTSGTTRTALIATSRASRASAASLPRMGPATEATSIAPSMAFLVSGFMVIPG